MISALFMIYNNLRFQLKKLNQCLQGPLNKTLVISIISELSLFVLSEIYWI